MTRTKTSVARAVLTFAVSGLLVLVLVGMAGVFVLRRVGTAEAMREAEDITMVAGRGIVQPRLTNGIVRGDAASLAEIDALVTESVVLDPIVRVKIWDTTGLIVYSDALELIGSSHELDEGQRTALRTGTVTAQLSDLAQPENRLERGLGPLLEVSLPVFTPDGTELIFQASLRFDSVAASGRELWSAFLPVLAVALGALALLQIPLAYRLARRVRDSQRDRERLLRRAIESSDVERRRIAGDLHDGAVQQLAGLSMSLAARADSLAARDPEATDALRDAASKTRQGMRSLRSALMGIYPPTLQRAGLPAALSDLVAPLAEYGVDAEVDVPEDLDLPPEMESLVPRIAGGAAQRGRPRRGLERPPARVRRRPSHRPGDRRRRAGLLHRAGGIGACRRSPRPSAPRGSRTGRGRDVRGQLRPRRGHPPPARGASSMIRIVIADDHKVVRAGLEQLIETFDDVELVGTATGGMQAVELCGGHRPDVALLDLEMPDIDGIEATRRIRSARPQTHVVVFTSFSDRGRILQALDAGAIGYLLKDAEPDELHRGIVAAARGEAPLAPKAAAEVLAARSASAPIGDLSDREREVLVLVASGLANKQIARKLGISEKTVKGHLTRVFQAVGATDRTQAALWAERNGLLPRDG
jgi:two-component system, NarL family, sensor kinase